MKLWLYLRLTQRTAVRLWRVRRELRSNTAWALGFFVLTEWESELLSESEKYRVVRFV